MVERLCRNGDRTENATLYYRWCADEIMARALSLPSGGRRRKVHRRVSATSSVQPA